MRNFKEEIQHLQQHRFHEATRIARLLVTNSCSEEWAYKQIELIDEKIRKLEQEENDFNLADYRDIY